MTRPTSSRTTSAAEGTDLRAAFATAVERLSAAGVAAPRHDATELLAVVLGEAPGLVRARLVTGAAPLTGPQETRFDRLLARRAAREPLQHLTGSAGFRTVTVAVGPGAFVPRPETELVAGAAVAALARAVRHGHRRAVAVDLGCGPGTIALALVAEVPTAEVHAVEVDPAALAWARRNLAGRGVRLHECDLRDHPSDLDGRVDVVVSNPPYLPTRVRSALPPEVRDHDPERALFGGPDGLDVVRAVAAAAARLLRPGGVLVVEHGDDQGRTVPALVTATGWFAAVTDHDDLLGRPRFTTAVRTGDQPGGDA